MLMMIFVAIMARKPPKGKSLAELNPELAKQWHPTKNGDLTPNDVSCGSKKKVWWKCKKGDDHEWETTVAHRSNGTTCPICSNQKVVLSNCLATNSPELAKQWHPSKNGELTPFDVSCGSNKKVWWKCKRGNDHEWEASPNTRRTSGCSICSGRKVVLSNCLATTHPDWAEQWHPTKNRDLTPYDIVDGSTKNIWWKCDKGDDHEWQVKPVSRKKSNTGCPICSGRKAILSNCLAIVNPKLATEWHPTKNGDLTPFDVKTRSGKLVWWKCDKGDDHEWKTSPHLRKHNGCPICSSKKVVLSNCLATTHPNLAQQWHPTKNGDLTPFNLVSGSGKLVWWKCDKGDDHEWKTSPNTRSRRELSCPVCSNQKVVLSNCLATTHPNLAQQWHPTKNGDLTPFNIVSGTMKKVWWICDKKKDHEWRSILQNRSRRGDGCPYCTLTPQSKQELTITFELLQFFKNINPKGFKTRVEGKLWSIDIYIPELNLGIEFDGQYWHKDKNQLDKLKTKQLKKEGFEIIRVRQKPLKRIFKTDVMAAKKFNGKKVTNDVLLQIMKMYKLDGRKLRAINNYLEKEELQNQKGLDKYIDQILTEKAEKR
jgi:very-short-patch-repair endonuclease/predicted secreted protein